VQSYTFITSALAGGKSALCPGRFTPGNVRINRQLHLGSFFPMVVVATVEQLTPQFAEVLLSPGP
jgi:hypothetical protein